MSWTQQLKPYVFAFIAVLALKTTENYHRATCTRKVLDGTIGTIAARPDFYWKQKRPTTAHGICAHMSERFGDDDFRWAVEVPTGFNPKNRMSTSDYLAYFRSRGEAESFVEKICPSDSGPWTVVTQ